KNGAGLKLDHYPVRNAYFDRIACISPGWFRQNALANRRRNRKYSTELKTLQFGGPVHCCCSTQCPRLDSPTLGLLGRGSREPRARHRYDPIDWQIRVLACELIDPEDVVGAVMVSAFDCDADRH